MAYEARRAANVERNQRVLQRLGLDKQLGLGDDKPSAASGTKKRRRGAGTDEGALRGVRRSTRRRTRPQRLLAGDEGVAVEHDEDADAAPTPRAGEVSVTAWETSKPRRRRSGSRAKQTVSPRSSRNLTCDVDGLVAQWLGKEVPPLTGAAMKAAAMIRSCKEGVVPKFSRMSGIQQWANAVALFVNIGGVDYHNLFWDKGRQVTWFAQRTQHPFSPVIVRLRRGAPRSALKPVSDDVGGKRDDDDGGDGDNDSDASEPEPCSVVLWCRLPGRPYVFCGRLRFVAYDRHQRPLRFLWELQDYDALMAAHADTFVPILSEGGPTGEC